MSSRGETYKSKFKCCATYNIFLKGLPIPYANKLSIKLTCKYFSYALKKKLKVKSLYIQTLF